MADGISLHSIDSGHQVSKQLLHWLLQITKAINYNLPADQLFSIYESVLRDQLKVSRLALYLHEDRWMQALGYGLEPGYSLDKLEERFGELNELQLNNLHMPSWTKGFESIIPVYHNEKPLAYAFIGGSRHPDVKQLKEILPFIHTITNIIVVAIENKRLSRESIRQAQVQRELELAARMQNMLFPAQEPKNPLIELSATYLPHQQVGGDYYDYLEVSPDELLICLADVSGKGVSAALLMSNFQANLNARAAFSPSLPDLVMELNRCVNQSARGEKFITVFLALINTRTHMIRYVNAGHNPPFICGSDGQFHLLNEGCTGLGMFPELPFIHEGLCYFAPGSILFCYTDGIVEQENASGEIYGMEKLMSVISAFSSENSLESLNHKVINDFREFQRSAESIDDVTLLSCRILPR